MATILTTTGDLIPLIGKNKDKSLSLDQMQAAVDGNIEPIYNEDHSKVICIVNEEGMFRNDLPFNIYAREMIAKAYNTTIDYIQDIRGNVIVLSKDDGGNWS